MSHLRHPLMLVALLLALIAGSCSAAGVVPARESPEPDLSAIEAFWPLYDTLRAGGAATPGQWDALFAAPAYRYLNSVERKERLFRKAFPAVFGPRGEEATRGLLADEPAFAPFVEHYRRVVEHEGSLRALQRTLEAEALLARARTLAEPYLPERARSEDWWPSVAYCIHAPDGTSYQGSVILDLLAALDLGPEGHVRFLAHEMHHAYLERSFPAPSAPDAALERVFHALNQLRIEGVADLIDKNVPMRSGGLFSRVYVEAYNSAFDRSAEILAELDRHLVRIRSEPDRVATNAEALWSALPLAGHPTGAFMARTVLDVQGIPGLVAALESPFAFVRAYASCALTRDVPRLSSEALAVIDELERESIETRELAGTTATHPSGP